MINTRQRAARICENRGIKGKQLAGESILPKLQYARLFLSCSCAVINTRQRAARNPWRRARRNRHKKQRNKHRCQNESGACWQIDWSCLGVNAILEGSNSQSEKSSELSRIHSFNHSQHLQCIVWEQVTLSTKITEEEDEELECYGGETDPLLG